MGLNSKLYSGLACGVLCAITEGSGRPWNTSQIQSFKSLNLKIHIYIGEFFFSALQSGSASIIKACALPRIQGRAETTKDKVGIIKGTCFLALVGGLNLGVHFKYHTTATNTCRDYKALTDNSNAFYVMWKTCKDLLLSGWRLSSSAFGNNRAARGERWRSPRKLTVWLCTRNECARFVCRFWNRTFVSAICLHKHRIEFRPHLAVCEQENNKAIKTKDEVTVSVYYQTG